MDFVDENTLLSPWQHTLARETSTIPGQTLRGYPGTIIFKPANANTGRVIHVTHRLKAVGRILLIRPHASPGGIAGLATWTEATDPLEQCTLGVVEHVVSAMTFAGLDNVIMHLDYPDQLPKTPSLPSRTRLSCPLLSGTGQEYLQAVRNAGLQPQSGRRHMWTISAPQHFVSKDGQCRLQLYPRTKPGWSLEALNANAQRGVVSDHAMYHVGSAPLCKPRPVPPRGATPGNLNGFQRHLDIPAPVVSLTSVVTARPPQLRQGGYLAYRAATIGVGGKVFGGRKFDFAVVNHPLTGQPLDGQSLMESNEQIRHRLYDATADVFGFGLTHDKPTIWPQVDTCGTNLRHRYGGEIRSWLHGLYLTKQLNIH